MSVHISSAVWKLALDSTQKLVLLRLADCCDHDGGNAWPSVATIGKDCGISESTVQRALRELERAGYIEVQRASAQHRPTTYRVVPSPRPVKMTPRPKVPQVQIPEVSSGRSGVSSGPVRGSTHDTRSVPLNRPSDPVGGSRARAKGNRHRRIKLLPREKRTVHGWYEVLTDKPIPSEAMRLVCARLDQAHPKTCIAVVGDQAADKRDPWRYFTAALEQCATKGHNPRPKPKAENDGQATRRPYAGTDRPQQKQPVGRGKWAS